MRELQEQVRDLMFYLETQKKIAQSPEGARQVSWRATPVCTTRVCVSDPVASLFLCCTGAPRGPGGSDSRCLRSFLLLLLQQHSCQEGQEEEIALILTALVNSGC